MATPRGDTTAATTPHQGQLQQRPPSTTQARPNSARKRSSASREHAVFTFAANDATNPLADGADPRPANSTRPASSSHHRRHHSMGGASAHSVTKRPVSAITPTSSKPKTPRPSIVQSTLQANRVASPTNVASPAAAAHRQKLTRGLSVQVSAERVAALGLATPNSHARPASSRKIAPSPVAAAAPAAAPTTKGHRRMASSQSVTSSGHSTPTLAPKRGHARTASHLSLSHASVAAAVSSSRPTSSGRHPTTLTPPKTITAAMSPIALSSPIASPRSYSFSLPSSDYSLLLRPHPELDRDAVRRRRLVPPSTTRLKRTGSFGDLSYRSCPAWVAEDVRARVRAEEGFRVTRLEQERARLAAELEQARLIIADLRYAHHRKDAHMEERINFHTRLKETAERELEQMCMKYMQKRGVCAAYRRVVVHTAATSFVRSAIVKKKMRALHEEIAGLVRLVESHADPHTDDLGRTVPQAETSAFLDASETLWHNKTVSLSFMSSDALISNLLDGLDSLRSAMTTALHNGDDHRRAAAAMFTRNRALMEQNLAMRRDLEHLLDGSQELWRQPKLLPRILHRMQQEAADREADVKAHAEQMKKDAQLQAMLEPLMPVAPSRAPPAHSTTTGRGRHSRRSQPDAGADAEEKVMHTSTALGSSSHSLASPTSPSPFVAPFPAPPPQNPHANSSDRFRRARSPPKLAARIERVSLSAGSFAYRHATSIAHRQQKLDRHRQKAMDDAAAHFHAQTDADDKVKEVAHRSDTQQPRRSSSHSARPAPPVPFPPHLPFPSPPAFSPHVDFDSTRTPSHDAPFVDDEMMVGWCDESYIDPHSGT